MELTDSLSGERERGFEPRSSGSRWEAAKKRLEESEEDDGNPCLLADSPSSIPRPDESILELLRGGESCCSLSRRAAPAPAGKESGPSPTPLYSSTLVSLSLLPSSIALSFNPFACLFIIIVFISAPSPFYFLLPILRDLMFPFPAPLPPHQLSILSLFLFFVVFFSLASFVLKNCVFFFFVAFSSLRSSTSFLMS